RHEHVGMSPVEAIDVVDVLEMLYALVDPRKVEIRRADEVDRPLVAMEEQAYVRNGGELLHASPPRCASRPARSDRGRRRNARRRRPARRVRLDGANRLVGEHAKPQLRSIAMDLAGIERFDEG